MRPPVIEEWVSGLSKEDQQLVKRDMLIYGQFFIADEQGQKVRVDPSLIQIPAPKKKAMKYLPYKETLAVIGIVVGALLFSILTALIIYKLFI